MSHESYADSMNKWDKRMWKKLESALADDKNGWVDEADRRTYAWYQCVWTSCGFCKEFNTCLRCPLYPKHCASALDGKGDKTNELSCEEANNTMWRLWVAWRDDNRHDFELLREHLIHVMSGHKKHFKR